jgi:ABC-type antimicrobial peptide transport system permease subunit
MNKTPPPIAEWVLSRFLKKRDQSFILGDFEELYSDILRDKGPALANLWYWGQLLKSLPAFLFNAVYWSAVMFRSYLKVSIRSMKRQKIYSFINILGLGTGLACTILILLWVTDELSFDRFHENLSTLYRVEADRHMEDKILHSVITPSPLGPRLEAEVPEIVESSRFEHVEETLVRYEGNAFYEDDIYAVDPSFFEMFSFPASRGGPASALNDPNSVVMTEDATQRYFKGEDPVGKVLSFNNQHDFTVTGVLRNVPRNSSLRFGMLISQEFLKVSGLSGENFRFFSGQTFVRLSEGAAVQQVNEKIVDFLRTHDNRSLADLELKPLAGIHLHSYSGFERRPGDIQYVYIFSVIAVFVLAIACINYMNLSTARSANRSKEIGMRKVVGAARKDIVRQFYSESVICVIIALVFALLLVKLVLPAFSSLTGKEFSLNILGTPEILLGFVGILMTASLMAGSYPALFLSSFRPAEVLGGRLKSGPKSSGFRGGLVLVQFSLSIVLVIGTAVVTCQLDLMKNKKLGYDKENLVYVPLRGETRHNYGAIKRDVANKAGILGITGSGSKPSAIYSQYLGADWDGKSPGQDVQIGVNAVDFDFVETLKVEMKEGRDFSENHPEDLAGSWIVNEELAKIMGLESPLGMRFSHMGISGRIIGVMNDFRFRSAREKIVPLAVTIKRERLYFMLVRLQTENATSALDHLRKTWESINPGYPFDYQFLDADFDSIYRSEERMGNVLKSFSVLAVIIACLGLFGLASFLADQRTKEIGIRKALGASVFSLVLLLSKEYSRWILLANLFAWPVAWYAMHRWLENFAYRTEMNIFLFVLAGMLSFVVAALSFGFQSLKAAMADPVASLRYE